MTAQVKQDLLPVTQADRDAAADRLHGGRGAIALPIANTIDRIREGKLDGHAWVQAFARHRLAHASPTSPQGELADELERLAEQATPAPWMCYGEPEVGLPPSLFAGTPMQSGFAPIEPLQGIDIDLIAKLRNNLPSILTALRTRPTQSVEVSGLLRSIRHELAALIPDPTAPMVYDWPCTSEADRECLQRAYDLLLRHPVGVVEGDGVESELLWEAEERALLRAEAEGATPEDLTIHRVAYNYLRTALRALSPVQDTTEGRNE